MTAPNTPTPTTGPSDEVARVAGVELTALVADLLLANYPAREETNIWRRRVASILVSVIAEACARIAEDEAGQYTEDGEGDAWIALRIASAIRALDASTITGETGK